MILKILAPLSATSKRTRLEKIVECTKDSINTKFYGWQREKSEIIDSESKIILKGGGYSSKRSKLMYPIWSLKVFFLSLSFQRSDLVWALGLETAFPAVVASKIRGFKVIYDDADRFSSLFNFNNELKKILVKIEIYTSNHAFKHVIPGLERYDFNSPNFFVLKNTPTGEDVLKAKAFKLNKEVVDKLDKFNLVIYVNGWLGEGRGMKAIHHVAKSLPNHVFLLAGRIDSKYAKEMQDFNNVIYLGELPQYEALAYYTVSNFVFTYYDPKIPINRMAEANKWGDSLQFNVPVIVNSEVETAKYLLEAGAAISVEYEDVESLIHQLEHLSKNSEEYQKLVISMSKIQTIFPSFDLQVKSLFENFN